MKKRNLLFASLILSLGIGLFSCNVGNGGNVTNFPASPAVVSYDMNTNIPAIGTWFGYCVAPDLDPTYVDECVILSGFTIDYDHQPSTDYATATNVVVSAVVPQKPLEMSSDSVRINNYTLPISNAGVLQASDGSLMGISPNYYGKVFIGVACKDNNPDFRLVYNTQEPDSAGIKNLYLLALPSSSSSATNVSKNYAFDIMSLIQYAGRDTTDEKTGYKYKYVKANLKYLAGISDNGVPTYGTLNTSSTGPYLIAVYVDY